MKTIDEVIKALELCSTDDDPCDKCPYTEFDKNGVWACSMCGDFAEDALHYLKEYRTTQTAYIKAMADLEDNPPLTWDELHTMKGKPVWIEEKDYKGHWAVINDFDTTQFGVEYVQLESEFYDKAYMGTDWQAYRKERHEDAE